SGEASRVRCAARGGDARLDRRHGRGAEDRCRARAGEEVQDQVRDADPGQHRMSLRVSLLCPIVAILALTAAPARAHEMTMAEMEVRETSPGEFLWQWSASSDKRPMGNDLVPRWPEGCSARPSALRCGSDGLKGMLAIEGVGKRYSAAMVKVV